MTYTLITMRRTLFVERDGFSAVECEKYTSKERAIADAKFEAKWESTDLVRVEDSTGEVVFMVDGDFA